MWLQMYRTVKNTDKPAVLSGGEDIVSCISSSKLGCLSLLKDLMDFHYLCMAGQSDGFENGSSGDHSEETLTGIQSLHRSESSGAAHCPVDHAGVWSNTSR